MSSKTWNSLEVSKLTISIITPLLIFWLGCIVNKASQENKEAIKGIEKRQTTKKNKQQALQNITRSIYERTSRTDLLISSIKRNLSTNEIVERKRSYDETFFNWNREYQINLLLVRGILERGDYSNFEDMMQTYLMRNIFTPMDTCITDAYDYRIKTSKSGWKLLLDCNISKLQRQALNCGYALTNELFKLTRDNTPNKKSEASEKVKKACEIQD